MFRSPLSFVLVLAVVSVPGSALAQPPCPEPISISIQATPQGSYVYQLEAQPSSSLLVSSCAWDCSYAGVWGSSTITDCYLPGPGNYLATATCVVYDDQQSACTVTGAVVLQVPPDTTACTGTALDFTISYDGGTFTFLPYLNAVSSAPQLTWDFGDATNAQEVQPQHSYFQEGHYQVCLTVVDGPCEKTLCKWLYFGSGEVQCADVLIPAVSTIVVGNTVAYIDESVTSGMFHHTTWDLGGGLLSEGPVAVQTYDAPFDTQVCAQVHVWGPLLEDTCEATTCVYPFTGTVGLEEGEAPEQLSLYPVPFRERLIVAGSALRKGDRWSLLDLAGRELHSGTLIADGTDVLALEDVAAGTYVLRIGSGDRLQVGTVIKQ
ncbi:MAG TPA: PKD domain-containing protein [Flavobacteriales bacterium]